MLKNMKLGTMTIAGFVIMLMLMAILGYVGYSGLSGVVDRAGKLEDVNLLVEDMLASRQQEKNFIIRGDKQYVDKVATQIESIRKQANETKAKFKDPANRQQMDTVIAEAGQYKNAFGEYVGFAEKQKLADGEMVDNARTLLAVAGNMLKEQKKDYQTFLGAGAGMDQLNDKLTKIDDANLIIQWALEARRHEKNFIIRGDKTYVDRVHKNVKNIVNLAADMKSRFNQAKNQQQADQMIASSQAYKAAFDEVVGLKEKQVKADQAMVAAAREVQKVCAEANANQKTKMDEQVATANKTAIGVSLMAILLGLAFAAGITRAISLGIRKVVHDIEGIVDATVNGKLDSRADVDAVGVDFRQIPAGINDTLDAVIGPLNVAAEYVDRISKGDIPEKITDEYKGDFNEIKNNLNQAIIAINGLVAEAGMLRDAGIEGKLDTRGDASKFGGDFAVIVKGVNDTLDAVIGPLNVAAEYVDRISKGDIPEEITDEYKGDFNEIKNNLNQAIIAINGLVAEAGMLRDAGIEGKLDTRGDASKFGGDFAVIVKGVNDTLDAVIGPLNVAAEYVDRISKGDIPEEITDEYKGDFNEIKNNLNQAIIAINGLVAEAGMLRDAGIEGKLDTRGDASKFGGDFAAIVQGVNDTLDAVIGPLNVAAEYVDRISKGDIPEEITDEYKGDFNEIKNNLNQAIIAINGLVAEAGMLREAGVEGKLDTRGDASKFGGDFAVIVKGVNDTLDAVIGPLNVAAEYVDRISKGDIPEEITDEYKGDFNEIKNNLNQAIIAINGLVAEAGMLRDAGIEGKLDTRGDASKFGGDFAAIVKGVNDTLDAVIGPLNVAAEYVDRISKGDIPEEITDEYKGDFNEVKNNLNVCIDALNGLTSEMGMLAEAGAEGKLDTRGDVSKFGGDFAAMVKGVNDTLDAIVVPVNEAMSVIQAMADRDLTKKVDGIYKGQMEEFKGDINKATESLHDALSQASAAADQVGSASGQIASSSQQLAEGSAEQASSLEETSSSLEEMASMVKQNADNANQANKLMQESGEVVKRATQSMGDLTTSMEDISQASEETQKIIKTIDEIAFQTNLLALNAAVEAARAGEAGAGFAVVAEEVRNLAMRSADAAKNTAGLIEGTVKKVKAGSDLVEKTGGEFNEVAESSGKVSVLVDEIDVASSEQSKGIEEVNKAVAEMDKVTQQNAANAEESASASEEMSGQAQELNGMLASFKLNGNGAERKQITTADPKPGVHNVKKTKTKQDVNPETIIPMDDAADDASFKDF